MNRYYTRTRLGRALAVFGLGVALAGGVLGTPAQAANPIMSLKHTITVPGLVRHQIDVELFMSKAEAQRYIADGVRFDVKCWGDDFIDEQLSGCPRPGGGGSPYSGGELLAEDSGVHLRILNLYERGGALHEDLYSPTDEVYVTVRAIHPDGRVQNLTSNTIRGSF
jgi:hypothetical protein